MREGQHDEGEQQAGRSETARCTAGQAQLPAAQVCQPRPHQPGLTCGVVAQLAGVAVCEEGGAAQRQLIRSGCTQGADSKAGYISARAGHSLSLFSAVLSKIKLASPLRPASFGAARMPAATCAQAQPVRKPSQAAASTASELDHKCSHSR